MSFSAYMERAALDHVFGGPDLVRPATLYLAASTADPLADGSGLAEPSGNGYARAAVTNNVTEFPAASGDPASKSNANAVHFPRSTGSWGTITHVAVFDAASGGNMLASVALASSVAVDAGVVLRFGAGGIEVSRVAPAPATSTALAIPLTLSGAGRITFYMDYSERSTVGTHTFYVQRVFGTTGAVSVDFSTHGDTHVSATGTLSWADGEADIKEINVEVQAKADGNHRMYVQLTNPTGGAALHFGTYTRAYGVIDDGTHVAGAIYCDADAVTNGDGSQGSPYDNLYDARDAVGGSGTIYARGVFTVTAAEADWFGEAGLGINPPTGTDDENRVYIERWPGAASFTIQGTAGNDDHAFDAHTVVGEGSWVTYRGIDFTNVIAGIRYVYNDAVGVNVENCTFTSINNTRSGSNVGGVLPWGTAGVKVWRCTFDDIQVAGDNSNGNSGGVFTYDGTEISVQRCQFSRCYGGTYHKRQATTSDVSISSKFNIYDGVRHYYGNAGGQDPYNWSIISNNLFINGVNSGSGVATRAIYQTNLTSTFNANPIGLWSNNVFDGHRYAVEFDAGMKNPILYNNVFANLANYNYSNWNSVGQPSYSDYNWDWNGGAYYLEPTFFADAAAICAAESLECNTTEGIDPGFDADYRVSGAALTGGVGGVPVGPYLLGTEVIGPG